MIEHMRMEQRVVQQLFGGLATLTETAGTRRGPGTVEIRIDDRVVGTGRSLRAALDSRAEATAEEAVQ